ncbi:MAG: hypothetical protein QOG66_21 [Methylobacteriaceae bacterium]|jgi:hypothetical protein|nr:hypothetical protein [Methylobacteriaceae bacterium]
MPAFLKPSRVEATDASISATERRIADHNERIILDLMKGRDTSADEERVARDLVTLARMRSRRDLPGRRPQR